MFIETKRQTSPVALARKENSSDREVTSDRDDHVVHFGDSATCVLRFTSEYGMPGSIALSITLQARRLWKTQIKIICIVGSKQASKI